MKRRLFALTLAVLTTGIIGSCSKIDERLDDIDKRVEDVEQNKIVSIEKQITSLNSSIADLSTVKNDILGLRTAIDAKGGDISKLKAADATVGKRLDEFKACVDALTRYEMKDWTKAAFATLEQLNAANSELITLKETINTLEYTFDATTEELSAKLSNSINNAIRGINASISALDARVSALEQMVQSVTIIPAYSDGSIKAVGDILTINCVIAPKEAIYSLKKENFSILASEVLTKGGLFETINIEKDEDLVIDKVNGTATITVDVSSVMPAEEDKSLSVALNVKNGISDYTTGFVTVYATPALPSGALPGAFTVNDEGKQIHFSQGNLYYDGSAFKFETNQHDFQSSWSDSHVSHFFWSKSAEDAVRKYYNWEHESSSRDVFFTNDPSFTVDGAPAGIWHSLTGGKNGEWKYLFEHHVNVWGTCNSVPGRFIAPDGFEGDEDALTAAISDWETAQAVGIVFLPAAGYRNDSDISDVGEDGCYWSSTAQVFNFACYLYFDSENFSPDDLDSCDEGCSIRLVTEVQ